MTIVDKELNNLAYRKQELIRSYDNKEISIIQFNARLEQIKILQRERMNVLLVQNQKDLSQQKEKVREEKKMTEEVVEKPKTIGPKPKKDSYTMLIIGALMKKSIKTLDAVVDYVDEKKPGRDNKRIRIQATTIIGLVKKQKPARWAKYNWNAEEFLLTEKEE